MTCTIEGCDHPHYGRGWCHTHWRQWRRTGSPIAKRLVLEDIEWMAETGESWHAVVARLGVTDSALDKALRRWSRGDLAETLRGRVA